MDSGKEQNATEKQEKNQAFDSILETFKNKDLARQLSLSNSLKRIEEEITPKFASEQNIVTPSSVGNNNVNKSGEVSFKAEKKVGKKNENRSSFGDFAKVSHNS